MADKKKKLKIDDQVFIRMFGEKKKGTVIAVESKGIYKVELDEGGTVIPGIKWFEEKKKKGKDKPVWWYIESFIEKHKKEGDGS